MATGGLMALSAPGVVPLAAASWLAWIAFVPLLVAMRNASPRHAVLLGGVAAFVLQILAGAWLPGLLARFSGLNPVLAVAAAVLIAAAQSIGWAAWAGAVRLLSPRRPLVLVAPVCFLAMEFVMPQLFPHGIGLSQYANPVVVQVAELGGPHLVSALLIAFAAAVTELLRPRDRGVRSALVVAVVLLSAATFGWLRLSQVQRARSQAPTLRVGWVQAGVVHTGWSPPEPDADVLERYQQASAAMERAHGGVDLLIWPEKAYDLLLRNANRDYPPEHPRRIRRGFESPLLFGHTSVDRGTREVGNAAALLETSGHLRVVYEKVKLIPYSEWLPSWLEGKVSGGKRYRSGDRLGPTLVPVSGATFPSGEVAVGVFICFESTFPSHVRSIASGGAQVLVNLSDDTWFGDSAEPEQHLAHVVFRAVENRRDVVRATGGGVSALVASTGEVVERTELNRTSQGAARVGEVRVQGTRSLYAWAGDSVPVACAIVSLLWLVGLVRFRAGAG
jgi:apolipoprotein N-acyltransferase